MLLFVQKFIHNNDHILQFSAVKRINYLIIILLAVIVTVNILTLYSVAGGSMQPWAIKQLLHFVIFLPVGFLIIVCNPKFLYKSAFPLYIISLILLVMVKIVGHKAMGAQRWLDLKIIKIQPSELSKVALIMILSQYFHIVTFSFIQSIKGIIVPAIITIIPFILVCIQPDLATAVILVSIACIMIFLSGVRLRIIVICIISAIASAPIGWNKLHNYQKQRIINFLVPENDPLGGGYNIIQSKIAIGSGGLTGKGFLKGGQSQLNFLPESQTDFIFTVVAEEMGFIGSIIILLLYSLLIVYGIIVAQEARSFFLKMMALGSSGFFFCHIFINIAMTMGLLPAAGVPIPMLSYGGTIMGIGIVLVSFMINADLNSKVEI